MKTITNPDLKNVTGIDSAAADSHEDVLFDLAFDARLSADVDLAADGSDPGSDCLVGHNFLPVYANLEYFHPDPDIDVAQALEILKYRAAHLHCEFFMNRGSYLFPKGRVHALLDNLGLLVVALDDRSPGAMESLRFDESLGKWVLFAKPESDESRELSNYQSMVSFYLKAFFVSQLVQLYGVCDTSEANRTAKYLASCARFGCLHGFSYQLSRGRGICGLLMSQVPLNDIACFMLNETQQSYFSGYVDVPDGAGVVIKRSGINDRALQGASLRDKTLRVVLNDSVVEWLSRVSDDFTLGYLNVETVVDGQQVAVLLKVRRLLSTDFGSDTTFMYTGIELSNIANKKWLWGDDSLQKDEPVLNVETMVCTISADQVTRRLQEDARSLGEEPEAVQVSVELGKAVLAMRKIIANYTHGVARPELERLMLTHPGFVKEDFQSVLTQVLEAGDVFCFGGIGSDEHYLDASYMNRLAQPRTPPSEFH